MIIRIREMRIGQPSRFRSSHLRLARMTFQPDDVAKVTPEHEAYCKGLLALDGGAMGGGPLRTVRAKAACDFFLAG